MRLPSIGIVATAANRSTGGSKFTTFDGELFLKLP
jgi:hypothetical protein